MSSVDVLLPAGNHLESLIMTLSGIATQSLNCFRLIVADGGETPARNSSAIQSLVVIFQVRCETVDWFHRRDNHGIAEQKDFLLGHATGDYVLFIDDNVLMEPWVLRTLVESIEKDQSGFVGAFPTSLAYVDDLRPHQQAIELWDDEIRPETIKPGSREWSRGELHQGANAYHVAQRIPPGEIRQFKVAWIEGCVLYDRRKLQDTGGFGFWGLLKPEHYGEERLVQNLLMCHWGGSGIIPSGTYRASPAEPHPAEDAPNALDLLDEILGREGSGKTGERGVLTFSSGH